MVFDDSSSFGFGKSSPKPNRCKTFESSSPPEFKGDKVNFMDSRTNAKIELEKSRVSGFRRVVKEGNEVYRIKVCGK